MKKKTKEIVRADQDYLWHPFTQMKDWKDDQILVIEEGKGAYLKDTEGNWYIDGVSSLWVTVHGHRVSQIDQAIEKQLKKIGHTTLLGLANPPAALLSKKLIEITPKKLQKVFYSDSGSTAVEIALKMAYQYFQLKGEKRSHFVHFEGAYHGDTIGAVSVGGIDLFHQIFHPLLFKSFKAPWPQMDKIPPGLSSKEHLQACLNKLEDILKKKADKICAIITEPLIQGASGMRTAIPSFLKGVEKLCRKYKVLLIVDEVATGFGRTGKMFASEWENVQPDLLCLAKGITGGYLPLAATLASQAIYKQFLGKQEEYKTFFHGHTYTGNPIACAAAIANLDLFKKNKLLSKLPKKIDFLSQQLAELKKHPNVLSIRQKGLMVGIELGETQKAFPPEFRMGAKICFQARKYGVILRPLGDVIVLMPPLSITQAELKKIMTALTNALNDLTQSGPNQ